MKIIFICGSIEPGCDGVGDYVRRLSAELMNMGNEVAIIALKDKQTDDFYDGKQSIDIFEIPVLRLPFSKALNLYRGRVSNWIEAFAPDLLSLQFVPFSFEPKGLPFGLSRYLNKVGRGINWHIMFHELWVGMAGDSSMKLKCWGLIQRKMIGNLIRKLKPKLVHTNTRLYYEQLKRLDFHSKHLPLFSNIRNTSVAMSSEGLSPKDNGNPVYLIHFGLIHPGAPVSRFARDINMYSKEKNVKLVLRIVGRTGKQQTYWEKVCLEEGLPTELIGEQPSEIISDLLSSSTVGITTNPIALAEKSGSVAAMIEHGLPILAVSKNWQPAGKIVITNPGVLPFTIENLQLSLENRSLGISKSGKAAKVAEQFVDDLHASLTS